jgi:hypothetical protein
MSRVAMHIGGYARAEAVVCWSNGRAVDTGTVELINCGSSSAAHLGRSRGGECARLPGSEAGGRSA